MQRTTHYEKELESRTLLLLVSRASSSYQLWFLSVPVPPPTLMLLLSLLWTLQLYSLAFFKDDGPLLIDAI